MAESEIRLDRLNALRAAYVHASGDNPEETALTKILGWAKSKGLEQKSGSRLLGRNTYPTDQPEPHGYEYYLAVNGDIVPEGDVEVKALPEGMYAVFQFKNLFALQDSWKRLIKWVEENGHEQLGVRKTEHGWVNSGFEELLNWQEINQKPPTEWALNLWLQIKK